MKPRRLKLMADYGCSPPNARRIVLAIPKDWVIANLEATVAPLLRNADHLAYLLLGLSNKIARRLALNLARQAAANSDFDVREVGVDFLSRGPPRRRRA
jgi:hypothetical protein